MRLLLQRVAQAAVRGDQGLIAEIGPGLVVFVAIREGDNEEDARYVADKALRLRIFPDAEQRFNLSALDVGAQVLIVSQFTLYADTRKGRRPSFSEAAPPDVARAMFQQVVDLFQESGLTVATGRFQEHMVVEVHNDGPVTIWLDSEDRLRPRRGS
ncbi:MAG: D-tyrosyl-tRNA(Tyr) deacylase [Dehalococcoidia bacterium]|nr:D-tyrosyl-tRNA(Tyr) deacylase [Dehalococcoidia bacterium]